MQRRTLGRGGLEVSAIGYACMGSIPGTTTLHRLEENLSAANVELTPADRGEIARAAARIDIKGARLPEAVLKHSYR